jgi:hypothetical protein
VSMIKVRRGPARSAQTILGLLAVTLLLTSLATSAFGQVSTASKDDSYYVGYFSANNVAIPDASVAIVNPGSLAGYSVFDFNGQRTGDLCANIYVFDADQQMVECCSCFISPNALLQFSVNSDLTANPATGVKSTAGDIKLTSSYTNNKCTTSVTANGQTLSIAVAGTDYEPVGSLRAWGTHSRLTAPGLVTVTEVPFQLGTLSDDGSEFRSLRDRCFGLQVKGTLAGRCNCPSENVNGSK